jgi:CRISPR-associated protein Cmr6
MGNTLVLPESTRGLLTSIGTIGPKRHPGLQLDKFSPAGESKEQRDALQHVCHCAGDDDLLAALRARREAVLRNTGARVFACETTGPLTLHLARAAALENVGICLHPVYGFVYLPGSGLKGMASAYAETVWLPTQHDRQAAWGTIERVFGWATHADRAARRQDHGFIPGDKRPPSASGAVVFHEAWPQTWPRLFVDIANVHHAGYYRGGDQAPGDWESPVPVHFLAIPAGIRFRFAVQALAHAESGDAALAQEWLLGALCHLGAGAKTAAGYGMFRPVETAPPALATARHAVFEARLELASPAFLAGSGQQKEDCDLRGATLRGLLRWWWRTLHAAHADIATLRRLEAAVWGDTETGSPVTLRLQADGGADPTQYEKWEMQARDKESSLGLRGSPANKTTQGLWYLSYGMDETAQGQRRQRFMLLPGTAWTLRLAARGAAINGRRLEPADVLVQAQMALWLLTRFGGVGSKARKGFGSFRDIPALADWTVECCKQKAASFRTTCDIGSTRREPETPALETMLGPVEVPTPWTDPWWALHQAGFSVQGFAKSFKRNREKAALGLPRRIGAQGNSRWLGQDGRDGKPGDRYAAPWHLHLARGDDGKLTIRAVAFVAPRLPDPKTSREMLGTLLDHVAKDLAARAKSNAQRRMATMSAAAGHAPARGPSPKGTLPGNWEMVDATLLDKKTKAGGWMARHEPSGTEGPIDNSADVPATAKAGDGVKLYVVKTKEFRWPTPEAQRQAEQARAKQTRPPPRGPGRPSGPGRR